MREHVDRPQQLWFVWQHVHQFADLHERQVRVLSEPLRVRERLRQPRLGSRKLRHLRQGVSGQRGLLGGRMLCHVRGESREVRRKLREHADRRAELRYLRQRLHRWPDLQRRNLRVRRGSDLL